MLQTISSSLSRQGSAIMSVGFCCLRRAVAPWKRCPPPTNCEVFKINTISINRRDASCSNPFRSPCFSTSEVLIAVYSSKQSLLPIHQRSRQNLLSILIRPSQTPLHRIHGTEGQRCQTADSQDSRPRAASLRDTKVEYRSVGFPCRRTEAQPDGYIET